MSAPALLKRCPALALAALIAVSLSACAPAPPSVPVVASDAAPSPEALNLVRDVGAGPHFIPILEYTRQNLAESLHRKLPSLSQEHMQTLVQVYLMPELERTYPAVERKLAHIWSTLYTRPELVAIDDYVLHRSPARFRAFMATSLGQSVHRELPGIRGAVKGLLRAWALAAAKRAFAAHPDEIRALGIDPVTGNVLAPRRALGLGPAPQPSVRPSLSRSRA